jgi:FdhE protein
LSKDDRLTAPTVRVMSAEEIVARGGSGDAPYFHWPERSTVFAERAMRLRQLAHSHGALRDYLRFAAELAQAQQDALDKAPPVQLPDAHTLDTAARQGLAPLPGADWPRDPAWHGLLHRIAEQVGPAAPLVAHQAIAQLRHAPADWLEAQADALLNGMAEELDMAAAPIIGAALQVYWTHLVLRVQAQALPQGQPFGRVDDETHCPCCASRPTASLTRLGAAVSGQRYLHCALCSTQWHLVRIRCTHCGADDRISFQSLASADDADDAPARSPAILAECCGHCEHYLKIMHTERDPMIEPVADDLASLTLDLLVADSGLQRYGVNLLLLFGDSPPPERP